MITTKIKLTDDQMEAAKAELKAQSDWSEEYVTKNEDSPIADYVGWGWKEGDIDQLIKDCKREADDQLKEFIDLMEAKGLKPRVIADYLSEAAEIQTCGIHCVTNEFYRMAVGETHEEISFERLSEVIGVEIESLDDLEPDQAAELKDSNEYFIYRDGYFTVGSEYDQWVSVVDVDRLSEALVSAEVITETEAERACIEFVTRYRFDWNSENRSAQGIHLLEPDDREIDDAVETALRDGFKRIFIYR